MNRPEIVTRYPTIEINGTERALAPLGIEQALNFQELVIEALQAGSKKTADLLSKLIEPPKNEEDVKSQENLYGLLIILVGITHAKDKVINFLASLIGETPDGYKKLPLSATVKVVKGLISHPDLSDFFAEVKSLNLNSMMQTLMETLKMTDSTAQ
jgi:hypothetical protein